MDYSTAVHEASHAVVLGSVYLPYEQDGQWAEGWDLFRNISVIPKDDSSGRIGVYGMTKALCSPESIAVLLAGGIGEFRVTQKYAGIGGDLTQIARLLDRPDDTFMEQIGVVLCTTESTPAAIAEMSRDTRNLHWVGDPDFRQLAEAAELARLILSTHWAAVLGLGSHLLKNVEMDGLHLKYWLKRNGVHPHTRVQHKTWSRRRSVAISPSVRYRKKELDNRERKGAYADCGGICASHVVATTVYLIYATVSGPSHRSPRQQRPWHQPKSRES